MIPKTAKDFHRDPLGSFVAGDSWIYFAFAEGPHGYALWGTPENQDMERLVRVLEAELVREPPHTGLVDLRHLGGARQETFTALERYTTTHAQRLSQIVTRTAMVRPSGLIGVLAEGFFRIVRPPFEVSFHTDLAEAFESVGHPRPEQGAHELEEAEGQVRGLAPVMIGLTAYLEHAFRAPDLAEAARAMGMSTRSLQRQLTAHGTSFSREVLSFRISRARAALANTEESLTAIAMDLGFASPQHFSDLFRKATGSSPSAFRAEARGRPEDVEVKK